MRNILTSMSLIALLAVPGRAQDPEVPVAEFHELMEVSEVLLDVLVTDRRGSVVLGLDSEDFIVEESGTAVTLTGTSFYSNRFQVPDDDGAAAEESQQPQLRHPQPNEVLADRYFILFFHNPRDPSLVRQLMQATRQTAEWVESEMLGSDWVAVVSYDVKLKVHQDFTRDREALLRALKHAATGKDPKNVWATRRPELAPGQPALLAHLPEGPVLRDETTRIYDALGLVAGATRDVVGRKNLVLFSFGFGDLESSLPFARADARFYPGLEQAMNDNNMAIYTVDLKPLGTRSLQESFLTRLAHDTGGTYHGTFVHFMTPLQQIADESSGYYLLSYQAEHPARESGYRQVKVRMRSPELRVRARKGYRYGS